MTSTQPTEHAPTLLRKYGPIALLVLLAVIGAALARPAVESVANAIGGSQSVDLFAQGALPKRVSYWNQDFKPAPELVSVTVTKGRVIALTSKPGKQANAPILRPGVFDPNAPARIAKTLRSVAGTRAELRVLNLTQHGGQARWLGSYDKGQRRLTFSAASDGSGFKPAG